MLSQAQKIETEGKERVLAPRLALGRTMRHPAVVSAAIICLCFLLTSTGWLAWEYHLLGQVPAGIADALTMGVGYALQAAGIGLFALIQRRRGEWVEKGMFAALILHTLCLIPAILSRSPAGTIAAGLALNVFCGYIAGYYLHRLTRTVAANRRATALGVGYGLSILASWLLSRLDGIYYSSKVWIICLGLTALALGLIQWRPTPAEKESAPTDGMSAPRRGLLCTVGAVVLLFSVVNNSGFAFSAADLVLGIQVESSRLFYAVGLLIAGLVTDRDRKYGAVAALAALVIPFMMLALRREPVSVTVLWALNYFAYGFYSIYRMIVFSDLAEKQGLLYLAGVGLLIGRLGDAVGEAVCLSLADATLALIFLAALLFVTAVFLFFRAYRPLYAPQAVRQQSEQERFYHFAVQHDLSARERDMLRLLLEGKANGEIAQTLSISENTVKFHIRNLLQKTGCKNRNELLAVYMGQKPQ